MIWVRLSQLVSRYHSTMYICICNAVNESAILQAVENGVTRFSDLRMQTGCGTQCGSCVQHARDVMDSALTKTGSTGSTVMLECVSSG